MKNTISMYHASVPIFRQLLTALNAILDKAQADQLQEKGAVFYQWNPPRAKPSLLNQNEVLVRLVTSFATEDDQVDRFLELLG